MFPRVTSEKQSSTMCVSGLNIPTKKVNLTNLSQLPDDYCQTPGGTMFATTPGGTRIIYDRSFLLKMRNSPIASTPPKNLPYIAGVTTGISPESLKENKSPFKPSSLIKSETLTQKKIEQNKATTPPATATATATSTATAKTTSTTSKTTTTASKKAESATLETANEEPQFSMEM